MRQFFMCCTHDIEQALSSAARAPLLSLEGKLRIYIGKSANPTVLHLSGMCVSHHDTPVPNKNRTLLQPSTSLRPSSPPTRLLASDHEDRLRKLKRYSLEVNIQAHVRVNIHASLYCLVGFRDMFASTPWRIHVGWKMLQT